jgi:CHASE2 domain-containing sensor protein
MTLAELKGDVVILACAVSAGIHAALVPRHFDESTGAGLGFVGATIALAGLVGWMTWRPVSPAALAAAVVILVGLLASYALAITTGLPVLHPDPEPVDGLAVATKAIEAAGLLVAASLLWRPRIAATLPQPKGTLT